VAGNSIASSVLDCRSFSLAVNLNATALVSPLGHGPFRGRQAPYDDVRVGCLNVCSGVRTSRHQPIDRGHHDHRPSGTSPARRTEALDRVSRDQADLPLPISSS
jgi:hypothetical protein